MLKLDPVALTDVGRKREHNEDYLGDLLIKGEPAFDPRKVEEKGHLFAVADGMGGYAAGEVASELAINTLFDRYYNGPTSGRLDNDLMQAIITTNTEVYKAGTEPGKGQMGTTLTIAVIKGNRVLVGNVGDSRTYLIRKGIPLRITRDHSLVQEQIEMGALTPEQASKSLIRNIITRAIGHRDEVEPDLFEQELQPGDVILLCSDGLHGLVKEMEMGTIVAAAPNLQKASQELIDLANSRGGSDNISVLLIGINELGPTIPSFLGTPSTQTNGNAATLEIPAIDQVTTRTPAAAETLKVPAPVDNKPTVQTPVQVKKAKGSGGFIFAALFVLLAAAAIAAFLYISSNSSTSGNTTQTPTTSTTTNSAQTIIPTVTQAAAAIAKTSALPVAVSTTNPATAGGNAPQPPVSPGIQIDRSQIKRLEIWLTVSGWPSTVAAKDCVFRLERVSSSGLSLGYVGDQIIEGKQYFVFSTSQDANLELAASTYIVSAICQNQPAETFGLKFSGKDLRIEDNGVSAGSGAQLKFDSGVLKMLYSLETAESTTRGEVEPFSSGATPLPPGTTTPRG
ncbi:MAG: Stp1/IreP family PP2C-type Ser/Thr phosphatase [Chloroflexi bacterium]|uniref:Stp1/IreP family PP2C-type Ser/Thr phosphatase n=2 Tax=Bacteria TaxID=2 RepID=A0A8T7M0H4_9CHLR|nr:Stp1/IreP family PP2C-type Ser/Thr phosphatase [Chloroflexota bacterium]WJW67291.1 Stp1/IreP family PP2C-type Ser/Thr phosphatase [Chloroflexota bacterium L227-S17]